MCVTTSVTGNVKMRARRVGLTFLNTGGELMKNILRILLAERLRNV